MKHNMGFVDVFLRYALIMVCGILFGITLWYPLIVLAVIFFITAVSGWCPIYTMLGRDTVQE